MFFVDQLVCVLRVVVCVLGGKTVCEQVLELAQIIMVHLVYIVLHNFYLFRWL